MDYRVLLKSSLTSINRNKLRSFLTTLGVIIGVSSVTLLTAIGNGLTVFVEEQFEQLGSNVLYISPGELLGEEGGFNQQAAEASMLNSKLDFDQVRDLERVGYPVKHVAPFIETYADFRSDLAKRNYVVIGTTPDYAKMGQLQIDNGRFFSDTDETGKHKVVVLGPEVAEKLFPNRNPVGQNVTISNIRFKVVGVTKSQGGGGGFGGPNFDELAYIPLSTTRAYLNIDIVNTILVQVVGEDEVPRAKDEINEVMLKHLDEDDYSITDQTQILETIQSILGALTAGLAGIAAISLVVGGIGIMNIMLVAVTERTKEIGLRKALGATPTNIMIQFLIESAVLSTLGGLIGIFIGIVGSIALNNFFPAQPALNTIVLAFGVSLATGIIFGVFPARKAAGLSPIEALRYE